MKNRAFTLIEIVIAISISLVIMVGIFGFLNQIQTDIGASKDTARMYTNMTDFVSTMRNFGKLYGSGNILVSGSNVYNVALLTRPDKTSGVLIGVVDKKDTPSSRLDPIASKNIYGNKVIAYQKLTASQITAILASTGSVYSLDFSNAGTFPYLNTRDFVITPYNSGALLEYRINIETPFYNGLRGQNVDAISNQQGKIFPFILDF